MAIFRLGDRLPPSLCGILSMDLICSVLDVEVKIPKRATSPMIDAVAGGISGMVGIMAGSPFDVVKVKNYQILNPFSFISPAPVAVLL